MYVFYPNNVKYNFIKDLTKSSMFSNHEHMGFQLDKCKFLLWLEKSTNIFGDVLKSEDNFKYEDDLKYDLDLK